MNWDYSNLQVQRVVVHDIPRRRAGDDGAALVLSEVESKLDDELRHFFKERITETLGTSSFLVEPDSDSPSPVPGLIHAHLSGAKGFVARSQEMANHLYSCQTGINPSGLLVVIGGTFAAQRCVVVLKLEKEEGVRVRQSGASGHRTFLMEHLRDLMLTDRTRVFKVGLFVLQGVDPQRGVEGVVSDKQRGFQPRTEVAEFFLKRFLGCRLRDDPAVMTKRFYEATERFINEEMSDPEAKAESHLALVAELRSNVTQIDPRQFAQRYLKGEMRQRYVQYLSTAGVPAHTTEKDVSQVSSQLPRIEMNFESGIAVVATTTAFEAHVRVTNLDDGRAHLEIEDRMRNVRGRR